MNTKNIILLVLVVGAGAGVIWMLTQKPPEEQAPDSAETITHWMCDKCGNEVRLTAKQLADWMKDLTRIRRDTQSRTTVLKCDKCGTLTLCRSTYCPEHKIRFVMEPTDGKMRDCPKCPPGSSMGG